MRFLYISLFFLLSCQSLSAANLDLHAISLRDALQLVAKRAHMKILVSPDVNGEVSISVQDSDAKAIFESLLLAHHLSKLAFGDMIYVAPHASLIRAAEEKQKLLSLHSGSLLTQVWQIKYAQAEEIVKLLQVQLQSGSKQAGQISFDARTNKVVMRNYARQLAVANRLIKKLDVPVKQVTIETRLASVDIDAEQELGLQFATQTRQQNDHAVLPSSATGKVVLTVAKLTDNSQLDVALAALEQEGKAELISSPSLFACSQQEASIEAGEEVPYQETSRSGGTAVAFKKAVLGLKVKPQVLPQNKILLNLQVNQDRPASRMIGGVPAISTRKIKTNVLLKDGETAVLGGIYEINHERNFTSVPFLGRIPLIGLLFTHKTVRENKRELLIFVTPRIKTI